MERSRDSNPMTPSAWPPLPVAEWQETRDTLHLWTQIVGKVQLARTPLISHWWNVALTVTARGLSTPMLPAESASFQMEFDFIDHRLVVSLDSGTRRTMALVPQSVADFYTGLMGILDDVGVGTPVWTMPVEIREAIPFDHDHVHASYDREAVERFWRALVRMAAVFETFRAGFLGKASPVQFYWGGFDLAISLFSGRPAPPYRKEVANLGPHVMREAYSHESTTAGYWNGPDGEGNFYAFHYPEPNGYRQRAVAPSQARYDRDHGEFLLPYEAVRTAAEPHSALLEFLLTTYEAGAATGAWDREALER
jgi:Family of unknown function (DUF5996)